MQKTKKCSDKCKKTFENKSSEGALMGKLSASASISGNTKQSGQSYGATTTRTFASDRS